MRFIILNDDVGTAMNTYNVLNEEVKKHLDLENLDIFYVKDDGEMFETDSLKKEYPIFVPFVFNEENENDKTEQFSKKLTSKLQKRDVILIDLALSQKERDRFREIGKIYSYSMEKDYSKELYFAPRIIISILEESKDKQLDVKIIVYTALVGPKTEEDVKLLLPKKLRSSKDILFMRTSDVMNFRRSAKVRKKIEDFLSLQM